MGVVRPAAAATARDLVAAGADLVVVDGDEGLVEAVGDLVALDLPVGVSTPVADVAAAAFRVGAVLAEDRTASAGTGWLAAAASAGASVTLAVAPCPDDAVEAALATRAAEAERAGIAAHRIALDPGGLRRPSPGVARPLVLDLGPEPVLAAACVGLALGYRVVRTTDVRTARRVADAVAAVLEAE